MRISNKYKNIIFYTSLLVIFMSITWRYALSDYAKINKLVNIMDKTTQVEVIENNGVKHYNFNENMDFFSGQIVHGVRHLLFTTKETKELEKNLVKSQIRIKYYKGTSEIGEAEVYFWNTEGKTKMVYYMNGCYFSPKKDLRSIL